MDGDTYVGRVHVGRKLIGRVGEVGSHGLYRLKEGELDVICFLIFPISAACFCSSLLGWW